MTTIDWTIVEKILIVFALTFAYGLERQRSHKPIGLGAFVLVAVGSCGLTIIAEQLGLSTSIFLLSGVVSGIGFLGAGALMGGNPSEKTYGFTTAASIWLFSIFGIIIGLGVYGVGLMIYVLVWIVVFTDRYLERKLISSYRKEISITTKGFVNKDEITNILAKYCSSFKLIRIEANRKEKRVLLKYVAVGLKKDIESLLKEFYENNWCLAIELGS
ncbi:MAG: MgtC/SapB family protein [Candidatus Nanoarchaeia archaeon]